MQCTKIEQLLRNEIKQLTLERDQLIFELNQKQNEMKILKEKLFLAESIQEENAQVERNVMNERNRLKKLVTVNGQKICAIIDTGSDYTIIRDDAIDDRRIPCNRMACAEKVKGIGVEVTTFIGKFPAKIHIDRDIHQIECYILAHEDIDEEMIIGLDIINNCTMKITPGKPTKFKKIKKVNAQFRLRKMLKWKKNAKGTSMKS